MLKNILFIFLFFFSVPVFAQKEKWLSASVLDQQSHKAVGWALIKAGDTYVEADEKGKFRIELDPSVTHITISHLGYKTAVVPLINFPKIVFLQAEETEMQEVIIQSSGKSSMLGRNETGVHRLNSKDLSKLTGFMGQKDPIRALQTLPGIGNAGEGNSGIFVRGGTSGQNLTLLDGATIYNPSHLLGLFSVFNPSVSDHLTVYKSGIPALYGGRLSALVAVESADEIADSIGIQTDISPFSLNIATEIPVTKDWSLGLYGRKTFFNQTVWPLLDAVGASSFFEKVNYDFYDLNVISNTRFGSKSSLKVSLFGGGDDFGFRLHRFNIGNELKWNNYSGSAHLKTSISDSDVWNTQATFSAYQLRFGMSQDAYEAGMNSSIFDWNVKTWLKHYGSRSAVTFGLDYIRHRFRPNTPFANSYGVPIDYGLANVYFADEAALFSEADLTLSSRFQFLVSLRANAFINRGPYSKVLDNNEIVDYAEGEVIQSRYYLEPSVSANYRLDEQTSLKFSFGRHVQPNHLISITAVNFPADFWMPSINQIQPETAWQSSLGIYRKFKKAYYLTAEVYYKKMKGLTEFSGGVVNLLDNLKVEDHLFIGKGNSFGTELLFKKSAGRLTGWLSYTLSSTNRSFPEINNGESFPFKYDRRHDVRLTAAFDLNKSWSISSFFTYASGNAFTMPVSRYILASNIVNEYGPYNGSRMPAFHRLDFSASKKLKATRHFEQSLSFSVYNVYSRENPIYSFYLAEGSLEEQKVAVQPKTIALLPILPAVSYTLKLKTK